MIKYLLLVVVLLILGVFVYFALFNRSEAPIQPLIQKVQQDQPSPTLTSMDADLDRDLTALEKDLTELDSGGAVFDKEIQDL